MSEKKKIPKRIVNGRLLKNYGSWMYCDCCNNTVGYLCYTTYQYFYFSFNCNCGNKGSFELGEKPTSGIGFDEKILLKKNRLCCAIDQAPLFSIVDKNLNSYTYEVICNKCLNSYKE